MVQLPTEVVSISSARLGLSYMVSSDARNFFDADDFRSLCGKLAALEKTAEGAPLVSVASGMQPTAKEWQEQHDASKEVIALHADDEAIDGMSGGADEWEML